MFLDTFTHAFCHPEQQTEDSIEDDAIEPNQPPSAANGSSNSSPASHVLLVRDGLSASSSTSSCPPSFGSRAVLRHFLVHCLRSSSIDRVIVLSLLFPHSYFSYLASAHSTDGGAAKDKLTIIDAVSDLPFPAAAVTSNSSPSIVQPASHPNTAYQQHVTCTTLSDLSALRAAVQQLVSADRSHSVLIVDGLSCLLLYHSAPSLLRWLLSLRALPNVALLLHADYACHEASTDPTWTTALTRIAGTRITTTAVHQEKVLQQTQAAVLHTTITAHIAHTRASGRTATKQEHYLLQPNSLTLTAASHTAPAAPAQQPTNDISSTLDSLMLDGAAAERQRQAKAAVVLPYAHQGELRVGYGAGGLEVRRVQDEVGVEADDELLDDEDDDVDDDLDI